MLSFVKIAKFGHFFVDKSKKNVKMTVKIQNINEVDFMKNSVLTFFTLLFLMLFGCSKTETEKINSIQSANTENKILNMPAPEKNESINNADTTALGKSINDSEMVDLQLPKEGVYFPIGPYDDGKEPEFGKYYDETGTNIITEGFLTQSYSIGKYEVTYHLWKKVYDWAITGAGKDKGYSFRKGEMGYAINEKDKKTLNETHPVTGVNWYDCIVWCNAYSEMTGAVPVYYKKEIADESGKIKEENIKNYEKFILRNAKTEKKDCDKTVRLTAKELGMEQKENGFRLPTWLEWQLAARLTDKKNFIVSKNGKDLTCTVNGKEWYFTKGSTVSGGTVSVVNKTTIETAVHDARKYANYGSFLGMYEIPPQLKSALTTAVGSLLANALDIYDMSGNVSEWCFDYYPKTRLTPSGRTLQGASCGTELALIAIGDKGLSQPNIIAGKNKVFPLIPGLRLCRTK